MLRNLLIPLLLMLAPVAALAANLGGNIPGQSTTLSGTSDLEGTIAAGGLDTSTAFPCFGAHVVIWRLSSSAAKRCSLATFQVSDDSSNWVSSSSGTGELFSGNTTSLANLTATALGGTPLVDAVCATYTDGTGVAFSASGYIPWRWMRIILRAGYSSPYGALTGVVITPIAIRSAYLDNWREFY